MGKNVTYNLKLKMQSGQNVFGAMLGPGSEPEQAVKALKEFGYDLIIMDREHSMMNRETVYSFIRATKEMDISLWIRPEDKAAHFRGYLDAGVSGIMLPRVNTVEETVHAINQAYFPPIGHRGFGIGMSPYPLDFQNPAEFSMLALTEYINNNTVFFPQTESLENISNLRHILSLEGVAGTIVGAWDLALDAGGIDPEASIPESITTEFMEEKLRQIVKICKEAGKVACIGGPPAKDCAKWAKEGCNLFLLGYAADGNVDKLRPLIEEAKSSLS